MNELTPFPIPAERVLPHRGTMLLLDEVTECREDFARSEVTIQPDHRTDQMRRLYERGEVAPIALIEMMSQGAAALEGHQAGRHGESPQIGYLAGIKQLEIRDCCRCGDTISAEVRQTLALGPATVLEGRVLRGDAGLASGVLKVWAESGDSPPQVSSTPSLAVEGALPGEGPEPGLTAGSPMRRAVLESSLRIEFARAPNRGHGEFCFADSFPGFGGHFPGHPILPGIIMLDMVLILCERILGGPVKLAEIEQAKFTGAVQPGQLVRVEVVLGHERGRWRVRASLSCEDRRVATVRLCMTSARASSPDHP